MTSLRPLCAYLPLLLCLAALSAQAQTLSGTVFRDYNADGTLDALESGQADITIQAYDAGGALVGSGTSAADGTYNIALSVGAGTPVRVEFSNLPAYLFAGPLGSDSQGLLAFAASGDTGVNLGLLNPGDYCQPDPDLATTCFIFGDQSASGLDTLLTFPYTAGNDGSSSTPTDYDAGGHVTEAVASEVGTVYSLAYQGASNSLFTGAYTKRHAGFGPDGPGAIYRVDRDAATVSLFLDLEALFPGAAGTDPHPAMSDFDTDAAAWDAVGKTGLGGMDISDDQETLWVVALGNRTLYEIPIGLTPTAPGTGAITAHVVPTPAGCAVGDARPFAVKVHDGKVYVGIVCSAESTGLTSDLDAVVYAYDLVATTWSEVFRADLDYTRGCANNGTNPDCNTFGNAAYQPAGWRAWKTSWDADVDAQTKGFFNTVTYAQPMLTDIEFAQGNLLLGLRDRLGDQTGNQTRHPTNGLTTRYIGISAGELLVAGADGMGGFTLESNGVLGADVGSGAGNGQGPGGGEFFGGEFYRLTSSDHHETSLGALGYVPGEPVLVNLVFDPVINTSLPSNTIYDAGAHWYSLTDGSMTRAFRVFDGPNPVGMPGGPTGSLFGKANGLGDVEPLCEAPTIEVGNRVWHDTNGNGVQDAGEPGIPGVTVTLACGGAPAMAVTDANGYYLFPNVQPGLACTLTIDPADAALAGRIPTLADAGSNDEHDSDGALSGGMVVAAFTSGVLGANTHRFDFGFGMPGTIGDFVWQDVNGDGMQTGEAGNGFDMVTVDLVRDTNGNGTIDMGEPVVDTQTTNAAGAYDFTGVLAGNYVVTVTDTNTVLTTFAATTPEPLAVSLSDGEDYNDADFGYQMIATGTIGDFVWLDLDGDGVQDGGEPGIAGVTLDLIDDANGNGVIDGGEAVLDTATTDGSGAYDFAMLPADAYIVTVTDTGAVLTGLVQTGGTDPHAVALGAGADYNDADFGFDDPGTAAIGDFVWRDADGDGVQDGGEPGIAGVTLDLIEDTNGNGTIDGGEPVLSTDTTDGSGAYAFTGLDAGDYLVSVTDTGTVLTGLNLTGGTQPHAVTLSIGETYTDADFGYDDPGTASIGDFVWRDADGDGVQDGGEAGIAGVTLDLIDDANSNGTIDGGEAVLATDTTDGAGAYAFTGLDAGSYIVTVTDTGAVLTGLTLTGGTAPHAVSLSIGEAYADADFGYDDPGTASIGDFVWRDADGDGVQDGGEPGIAGVTLDLIEDTNGNGVIDGGEPVLSTDTTDGSGAYAFTGLDAGNYLVSVTDTGAVLTGLNLTGGTQPHAVSLAIGEAYADADFGYDDPGTASIGDFVWRDENGDGVQDGGEPGIAGVTLDLIEDTNGNGVLDGGEPVLSTDTTDGSGAYAFTGLDAGDYLVFVTDTGTVLTGLNLTGGTQPHAVSLAIGEAYADADFGFDDPGTGSIGDFVWEDTDGDGVQDGGEPGIAGVTLDLIEDTNGNGAIDGGEPVLNTDTTDGSGAYAFTGLVAGDYLVSVTDTGTVLTGLNLSGGTQPHAVSLSPTENYTDADFGYTDPGSGSIGDTVYEDVNQNGSQDMGEPGIADVTLDLIDDLNGNGVLDGGEPVLDTATTAGDGTYSFSGLGAGDYLVTVTDTGAVLTDYTHTGGTDPHAVTGLGVGDVYTDADFGYWRERPVIGSAKSATVNGNHVTYDLRLENLGNVPLSNLSMIERLDYVFGPEIYWVLSDAPVLTTDPGTVTLNPGYDGSSDGQMLAPGSSLAVGAVAVIRFQVTVLTLSNQGYGYGEYHNQVAPEGDSPGGVTVGDPSDDGTEPDPNGNGDPSEPGENDPTVVILSQLPLLSATKVDSPFDDTNGNGELDPGEDILYTVVVTNSGGFTAENVLFQSGVGTHTTLVVGTVTTTQGSVTTGNSPGDAVVAVALGDVPPSGNATITFRVTVDNPLPANVTTIYCQGSVDGDNTPPDIQTDDPDFPDTEDPTETPIGGMPVVEAIKTDALLLDGDGDGMADPGESLRYTVVITNTGTREAMGAEFTSGVDPNTALVVGSVTTTQGTVTTGNSAGNTTVAVDLGTVAVDGSVTITFDVVLDNPWNAAVTEVVCQGLVTGDNFPDEPTDDGDTPDDDDPTVTPVDITPIVTLIKASSLQVDADGNGVFTIGDTLRYSLYVENTGPVTALAAVLTDTPDPNTQLVVGSVVTDRGSVTSGNSAGDTAVAVDLGDLLVGEGAVITFDVVLAPLSETVTQILNQAFVSGDNFDEVGSDDPNSVPEDDATVNVIVQLVPTLGETALMVLIAAMAAAAVVMRRRSL